MVLGLNEQTVPVRGARDMLEGSASIETLAFTHDRGRHGLWLPQNKETAGRERGLPHLPAPQTDGRAQIFRRARRKLGNCHRTLPILFVGFLARSHSLEGWHVGMLTPSKADQRVHEHIT